MADLSSLPLLIQKLLDLFQDVSLVDGATMQGTLRFILVTLSSDAYVTLRHLGDSLGGLLIVTDEDRSKDLLHRSFDLLIILDQVDSELSLTTGQLLDLLNLSAVNLLIANLIEWHEGHSNIQHASINQVLCRVLLAHNDTFKPWYASSRLQCQAVFIRLSHLEKSAQLAQDLRPVEVLVRVLILKEDYITDVLVLVSIEFCLQALLHSLNLLSLFSEQVLIVFNTYLFQVLDDLGEFFFDLGLSLVLLVQIGLEFFQVILVLGGELRVASEFIFQ